MNLSFLKITINLLDYKFSEFITFLITINSFYYNFNEFITF
jgi:hypothetical protein